MIYLKGTVPLISSSGESDFHNVAKVKGPGVVTGRYGTIGQVFYVEEDFWPLNTTLYVKDFKGNDTLFVYYFLKTISYSDYSDKAAVPGINRNHLHKAEIRVPVDPVYQRELAEILWALDSKIELIRETNQTFEQIAQAIFKSWFIDFDPVKAKITAKQSGQNGECAAMCAISGKTEKQLKVLDKNTLQNLKTTAALFPDTLVESELGELPRSWIDVNMGAVFEERKEKVKNRPDVKVVSAVQTGELKSPDDVFTKQVHSKDISKYKIVYPTDLAYNPSRINIGSAGFNLFDYTGAVSPVYTVMRVKEDLFLPFARMQMKRRFVKDWIEILCSGSVRQSLSAADLLYIPIEMPPKDILIEFNKLFECFESQIVNNNKEIKTLENIRDTLLPKLLSDDLDLRVSV